MGGKEETDKSGSAEEPDRTTVSEADAADPEPASEGPVSAEAEATSDEPEWVGLSGTVARLAADRARMAELLMPTARIVEQWQRQFSKSETVMRSLYDSSRVLDRLLPNLVKPLELSFTAQIAKLVSGPSPLLTARLAQAADFRVAELLKNVQLPAVQIAALSGMSQSIASLSESLIARTRFVLPVERSIAEVVAGWKAATVLPSMAQSVDLARLTAAGLTTWESTSAGAAILGTPAVEVQEPVWDEAPGDLRSRLRARLEELDAALVRKLDGVRERLARAGPDAAAQAASSLIELIDWALRIAAPEKQVLRWHAETGRPASELHEGRPTRRLKVDFVLVRGGRDPKSGEHFTSGLLGNLRWLEGAKHGLDFDDVTAVESLAMAVEGYLGYVLL